MLSYHAEDLGLLDTSESPIWEARSKLVIWRYIFEIPKKYSLEKWQRDKTNIISTVILQIIYSTVEERLPLGCFRKNHAARHLHSCKDEKHLDIGHCSGNQKQRKSLTEMEALLEPRKTHEQRHSPRKILHPVRPFFQLTRFWTSKWWKSIQSTRSNKTGYRNRDSFAKSLEAESIYPWKTVATITSWQVPFTVMQSAQTFQMEGIFQTWNFTPSRDKLLIMNTSCRIH